jgi:hypothetical protein
MFAPAQASGDEPPLHSSTWPFKKFGSQFNSTKDICVRDTVDEAVILFPPLVLLDENYPGMNASSLAHMNILSCRINY